MGSAGRVCQRAPWQGVRFTLFLVIGIPVIFIYALILRVSGHLELKHTARVSWVYKVQAFTVVITSSLVPLLLFVSANSEIPRTWYLCWLFPAVILLIVFIKPDKRLSNET